jgi:dCTP deaminase
LILDKQSVLKYIGEKKLRIEPLSTELLQNVGIDLRISERILRLKSEKKELDTYRATNLDQYYRAQTGRSFVIKAGENILASTIERIILPTDLVGFVHLKSTYARLGLLLSTGVVSPGFEGKLTFEMHGGSFPIRIHSNEAILCVFLAKLASNAKPYEGRYQGQSGPLMPRLIRKEGRENKSKQTRVKRVSARELGGTRTRESYKKYFSRLVSSTFAYLK